MIASRGTDLFFKGERRRQRCQESLCPPDQFHQLWKGIWTDFINGRVFLLTESVQQLLEAPELWEIPRAGLLPNECATDPPPEPPRSARETSEPRDASEVMDQSCVFEHRTVGVGKTDSDGKPTNKLRVVHHQSEAVDRPGSKLRAKANSLNGGSSKYWFPRVVLPTLADIVTRLVAVTLACPGAALAMAVKDVDAAFRRVRVVSRDVALLATRVGAIVVVFTVCTFGFVGSPGVFGAVGSTPLQKYHRHHTMPDKRWHGDVSMFSAAFVDDSCLISYRAGVSEWLTEACFLTGLWSMFGLGGLNIEKDKEVGQWSQIQKYCGLEYNLAKGTVGISAARLRRARALLDDSKWRHGNMNIRLQDLQSLHGSVRWYSQASRPLHAYHPILARLLSTDDPTGTWVSPRGSPSIKRWAWLEFWEVIELHRIMLHHEEYF